MHRRTPNLTQLVRRPRGEAYETYSPHCLFTGFRNFIERTHWDNTLLRGEKWLDALCVGGIIFSVLYFIPVLVVSVAK